MASTPTEAGDRKVPRGSTEAPSPLSGADLERVPGVLGRIARERAADYADPEGTAEDRDLPGSAPAQRPQAGSFLAALRTPGLSLVTEVKRGSPSQGAIADLDPLAAAQAFARGGAAALSVLTEPRHFRGSLAHLEAVARTVPIPAMRKEFVVHPAQLREAAAAGADAVLLIAAVLGDALGAYLAHATSLGLDALVEVHDEDELELAITAGAAIVGVNNRDLTTLAIDRTTAPRLMRIARDGGFAGPLVAESGYDGPEQLDDVAGLADAALVGTALAREGDLEEAVRRWRVLLDGRRA